MKNLVSIFAGHDANVSFWNAETNNYYTLEELFQKSSFQEMFKYEEFIDFNVKPIHVKNIPHSKQPKKV